MTFLDDKHIVAGFFRNLGPGTDPYIRIYDISVLDGNSEARATHDFILPFQTDLFVPYGGEIGRGCGYPSAYSEERDRAQYFSEDDEAIIYLRSRAKRGELWHSEESYEFEIYLWMSDLRRLVKDTPASHDTTAIPWDNWGHAAALALDSGTARFRKMAADVAGTRMYWRMNKYIWIFDYHPARVRRARSESYMVEKDKISEVVMLREGELKPGSPVAPRVLDRMVSIFSSISNRNSEFALCGDVVLIMEYEAQHPFGLKAIAAHSLTD